MRIRVLSEMSVRLQTIEHRMEVLHMQPPVVTKKRRVSEKLNINKQPNHQVFIILMLLRFTNLIT